MAYDEPAGQGPGGARRVPMPVRPDPGMPERRTPILNGRDGGRELVVPLSTKPAQSKVVLLAGQLLVVTISGCVAALIIALTAAAVRWLS